MTDQFQIFSMQLKARVEDFLKKDNLFNLKINKDKVWELYLESIPSEHNQVFKERRYYDCNCCRHFLQHMAGIVEIKEDGEVESIWDFETDTYFKQSVKELRKYAHSIDVNEIENLSFNPRTLRKQKGSNKKILGVKYNVDEDGLVFNHFYAENIPSKYVDCKNTNLINKKTSLKNTLEVFNLEAIEKTQEAVKEYNLPRFQEKRPIIQKLRDLMFDYANIEEENKEAWLWLVSLKNSEIITSFKNTSAGSLIDDIAKGEDVYSASMKYFSKVDPTKYQQKQNEELSKREIEKVEKYLKENDYMNSIPRRFAEIHDISVNDVLFSNANVRPLMNDSESLFASLKPTKSEAPNSNKITEISLQEFISKLSDTEKVEILFTPNLEKHLCSLIAPVNKEAKSLFKWNNGFSWAYNGNIADSSIREQVKKKGGKVDGVLVCSLAWNFEDRKNLSDLDLHVKEPEGGYIYYPKKRKKMPSSGMLDVDIIDPERESSFSVENINYTDMKKMPNGKYEFYVNLFSGGRGMKNGFDIQLKIFDKIIEYKYTDREYSYINGNATSAIHIATIEKQGSKLKLIEGVGLTPITNKTDVHKTWNMNTNTYQEVLVASYSPNYWTQNEVKTGYQHLMLFCKDTINEENPNGFFNEFIKKDILNQGKAVIQVLGKKAKVKDNQEQLSGFGIALDKRIEFTVKIDGRPYLVKN